MNPLRLLKLCLALVVCELQRTGGGEHTGDVFHHSALFLESFLTSPMLEERHDIL